MAVDIDFYLKQANKNLYKAEEQAAEEDGSIRKQITEARTKILETLEDVEGENQ